MDDNVNGSRLSFLVVTLLGPLHGEASGSLWIWVWVRSYEVTKRILHLDLVIFSSFQNLLPHLSGWPLGCQTWVFRVCALISVAALGPHLSSGPCWWKGESPIWQLDDADGQDPTSWGLEQNKKAEEGQCALCLSWDIHLLPPLDTGTPGSQAFEFRIN